MCHQQGSVKCKGSRVQPTSRTVVKGMARGKHERGKAWTDGGAVRRARILIELPTHLQALGTVPGSARDEELIKRLACCAHG